MAIIYTYPLATTIDADDTLILSKTNNKNATRTVKVSTIAGYFGVANAWNRIDANGAGVVQAVGTDQLLNLTSGSLTFTTVGADTINIEAPPGDGNIADRNLTFTNNWNADLIDFNWAIIDSTLPGGLENVMGFDKDGITIGGNDSRWSIPLNERNLGGTVDPGTGVAGPPWPGNIFLGGDDAGSSNHQFLDTSISLGVNALPFAGQTDYYQGGALTGENDTECIAIGYNSLLNWGTLAAVGGEQGGQNVAIGPYSQSLNQGFTSPTTTGSYNVSIGGRALEDLNSGEMNTALGHNAAWLATTASRNLVAGMEVANGVPNNVGTGYTPVGLVLGSDNLILGYHADVDDTEGALVIGNESFTADSLIAGGGQGEADYTLVIGNSSQSFGEFNLVIGNLNTQGVGGINGVRDTGLGLVTAIGNSATVYNPNSGVFPDQYTHTTAIGTFVEANGYANDAIGEAAKIGDPGIISERDVANNVTIGNYSTLISNRAVNVGIDSSIGTPGAGTPLEDVVAVGYGSNVQFSGGVALGSFCVPSAPNEFRVMLGGLPDISLIGSAAGTGLNSLLSLAGDLDIQGNKIYVNPVDSPNKITFIHQQAEFRGQTNASQYAAGVINAASPYAPDMNKGDILNVTLDGGAGAIITFNDADNRTPGTYIWIIAQGGVPATINWAGASYRWQGGVPPVLSVNPADVDIITFVCDAAGNMFGSAITGF